MPLLKPLSLTPYMQDISLYLQGFGYQLLDCIEKSTARSHQIEVIVYYKEGVSLDRLEEFHPVLLSKAYLYYQNKDVQISLMSSGSKFGICYYEQLEILVGEKMRLFYKVKQEQTLMMEGILEKTEDQFHIKNEDRDIFLKDIVIEKLFFIY